MRDIMRRSMFDNTQSAREKIKVYLTNAVVPAINDRTSHTKVGMYVERIPTDFALRIIGSDAVDIKSYIGHDTTAKLLNVEFNRTEYTPQKLDICLVTRLKRRQTKPGDQEITLNDLDFLLVQYIEYVGTNYADEFAFPSIDKLYKLYNNPDF